ncbi:hypothetical protein V2U93_11580 [Bacillus velezensis]|uniref:hypothetical protein n=1 Tax=Bacillus velezensis TaxID=492670 RepID=UPI0021F1744E|nr:hypothetical protein [Bacillus velezensis]MCV4328479.1 hypothetical protein [Bacillus velezensis]MEE4535025.1 hypothetical protein [Bacillus velezensis]
MEYRLIDRLLVSRFGEVRKEKDIPLEYLSQSTGIPEKKLLMWTFGSPTNKRNPMDIGEAKLLSEELGVNLEELFYEKLTYRKEVSEEDLGFYIGTHINQNKLITNTFNNFIHQMNAPINQTGVRNSYRDNDLIVELIKLIRNEIWNLKLSFEQWELITNSVNEIENELRNEHPKEKIIIKCVEKLKGIFMGVSTTVIGGQINALIATLLNNGN